ncbi:RNA binding protein fox-1 1 [Liparis tanakae]|uniref:RNA binding protein fox-1 1 n=1 Tax=Liparis tanakae TaxID=230148 RepID=A0A4Z2HR71_9TELE|nr:RNA binding protein fox-1 1 [Liparis tanakae]
MAQPFPPAQYPPPPQNGIPAEYASPHAHPPADYSGPSSVAEHALALYTAALTQSEQAGNDSSSPAITANTVTAVGEVWEEIVDGGLLHSTCLPSVRSHSSAALQLCSSSALLAKIPAAASLL